MKWVAMIVLSGLASLIGGAALSLLWRWFIMPVFTSAPPLDWLRAVGLTYTVHFIFQSEVAGRIVASTQPHKLRNIKDGDLHPVWMTSLCLIVLYTVGLGVGAIWHLVIG